MAKTPTIKPEEQFARQYADRLILAELTEIESAMKLSELADRLANSGLGLAEVRSLLASNPQAFSYHERRWVPAARLESLGRSLEETIRLLVERFHGPMPLRLVIREIAGVRREEAEEVELTVRRIIGGSKQLMLTETDLVVDLTWIFEAEGETLERALDLNRVPQEEFDKARSTLKDIDWRSPDVVASALKASAPIHAKTLGAVAWSYLNSPDPRSEMLYDGREFFSKVFANEDFVYGPDGTIHEKEAAKKWLTLAAKVADRLAPTVDIEDAAPIEIKSADVTKMIAKIAKSTESVTATKLLEEFYEITPSNKTFPDDLANIMTALQAEKTIQWVGGDRFSKPGSEGELVHSIPEPFQFVDTTLMDDEGDLVDIELTDEGLSSSLRKLLLHPLAMDVLDEDIPAAPKVQPDQVRLVLKSLHRELGTFPLAQVQTGWLDATPNIQELIFIDPQGRQLQAWVNLEARLVFNLVDWWYDQPVESGAVFTLTKTHKPNVFDFAWDEQTDPVVYISSQRMEDLRNMQERFDGMSTLDVLIEVMSHWPKGADFLTLLAEVNVVRRARRRLIASLLSSYQCFYQRSGSPVWHMDAKKMDLGFDKTKKKFIKK